MIRRQLALNDFCFIREEEFVTQLAALGRRFRLVGLEEGYRLLASGELREPTAVITFDDGFQNNFEVAYPALCAARAKATIFLVTDLVDDERIPWYCRLHDALTRTQQTALAWGGRRYQLEDLAARTAAANELKEKLKRLPHPELEKAVDQIVLRLEVGSDGAPPDPRFRVLSSAAIREMAASGLIEFGAHTGSHAILSRLAPDAQRDEIERSIARVSALTGQDCRLFAYPNGRFEDYDQATLEILRGAGIAVAVTAVPGFNVAATPALELRRFAIGGEPSMPGFDGLMKRSARGPS